MVSQRTLFQLPQTLTPDQKRVCEADLKQILLISAPAGCGKTVCAIERAKFVLRYLQARNKTSTPKILLLCFNEALRRTLEHLVQKVFKSDSEKIQVTTVYTFYLSRCRTQKLGLFRESRIDSCYISQKIREIEKVLDANLDLKAVLEKDFGVQDPKRLPDALAAEFEWMLDRKDYEQDLAEWYLQVERTGRGKALRKTAREYVLRAWELVRKELLKNRKAPAQELVWSYEKALREDPHLDVYDHVIIDEVQDLAPVLARPAKLLAERAR